MNPLQSLNSMTEVDVTLSDYGLALECLVFVWLISRRSAASSLKKWFLLFFSSIVLASLAGGTVHGFFQGGRSPGYDILWPLTLVFIGLTALAAWGIGATLLFSRRVVRRVILIIASVVFASYALLVLMIAIFPFFGRQGFLLAIVHYLPAVIFLCLAFGRIYFRERSRLALFGFLGMILTFVAAGIQQAKVSIHPVYLTHNTFYHLIQAVALFMIFWFARWFLSRSPGGVR